MIKKIQKFLSFRKPHPEDYIDQDSSIWDWLSVILILHVPLGGYYWAYVSWELGSLRMFRCVCLMPISIPMTDFAAETISTLKFADRAK